MHAQQSQRCERKSPSFRLHGGLLLGNDRAMALNPVPKSRDCGEVRLLQPEVPKQIHLSREGFTLTPVDFGSRFHAAFRDHFLDTGLLDWFEATRYLQPATPPLNLASGFAQWRTVPSSSKKPTCGVLVRLR